jgi:membrane-bound lytic murein transglycosylase B
MTFLFSRRSAAGATMLFWCWVAAGPALAQPAFSDWLAAFKTEAATAGISAEVLAAALPDNLTANDRVVELDRRQPEGRISMATYHERVVNDRRVSIGRERLIRHRALLNQVGAKYGVQPRFIVALWGIETSFTGDFSTVRSLATLAHDGRRGEFFRRELLAALRIIGNGDITADTMIGSWAGAMGQVQFMPTSYERLAVDEDGDGRRDIWKTLPDVFGSAANYLKQVGWRNDITWGRPIQLPVGFDRDLADLDIRKTLPVWQALGVRRTDGTALPTRPLSTSLVIAREGRPAFAVYDNYRALLRWNRSRFFATAVGLLSDRIR